MLFRFLDKLRAKPPHVRMRAAFLGASVVTAAIALAWVTTLPDLFLHLEQETAASGNASSSFEALRDQYSTLKDQTADGISDAQRLLQEIRASSTQEVVQIATTSASQ